jgi:PIN domain nuclease of toxin-antitoxin system
MNEFALLDITPAHIRTVANLPFIHRDPFDRMLVAQAMVEDMEIMTVDSNILKYDVKPIW